MISEYLNGIQHIGIPTTHFDETRAFYEKLGFTVVHEPDAEKCGQRIMFMQLKNLMLEFYEEAESGIAGAINHIAIDCSDVDKAFEEAGKLGLTVVSNGIEALPFWEKGIRFFIVEGPNKERVEIDQKL
ncbi:MAG: VOC family protein [Eubacteriales bacterium]|nr:VOC family protein [Eubacteriales bacterium]